VSYGQHHLLNAVTETAGFPAAVLIRALEPLEGLPLMRRRRARAPWRKGKRSLREAELCRGPGNLSRAMGISTDADNRRVLTRGVLTIRDEGIKTGELAWGSRIGITVGVDRQWRVVVAGHPSVSATRLANWGSDPDS
jgi:DNA-3-methyladenine glycosylase